MSRSRPALSVATSQPAPERWFGALFGAFLGLSFLKFGNPPIMEKWVTAPTNVYELVLGYPWPIGWAFFALALAVLASFAIGWQIKFPRWLLGLLLAWFGWQVVSAMQAVDLTLAIPTVKHFGACVACFCIGAFGLRRTGLSRTFWLGLLVPFFIVLAVGWEQHFGGLEQSRRYFFMYVYPQMTEVPPEYLKKISSERIFATLFYPNTLAGLLVLVSPLCLVQLWRVGGDGRMTGPARSVLVLLGAVAVTGCLYWSGSKGGWLLLLLLGVGMLLRLGLGRRIKAGIVIMLVVLGLAGFFWRYAGFFQRGATSVSARFDYWSAAIKTAVKEPWLGTGPGTFAIPYAAIKRPESEMARLAHNDYLQQASDSGFPGAILYGGFVVLALGYSFRRLKSGRWDPDAVNAEHFAVWLGVLGWALQSLMEFSLYIPALSWSAFALLGWLVSCETRADSQEGGSRAVLAAR